MARRGIKSGDAETRREFLQTLGAGACAVCAAGVVGGSASAQADDRRAQVAVHDAMWFDRLADKAVRCTLCPRECVVADVERGYCGVRENRGGDYKTLVYGNLCSINVDPIEKKPLFHYLPGTQALSVATAGCNMECKFCQNWEISQFRPEQVRSLLVPPENLVQTAAARGIPTIAYTYSEPVVFYEYMHDTAALARKHGIGSVMISNGYIQEAPLRELAPHLAAYKVDLKAFTNRFYREQCNAELAPVRSTLETLRALGVWTEIVVLIIPTLNDDDASNREMFRWIRSTLGPDVPVHLTRFHPTYKILNLPRTPVTTLERLHALGREAGLHYVYLGNVPGHAAESTYCPRCGARVIERYGYLVLQVDLQAGRCRACGEVIPGVWS